MKRRGWLLSNSLLTDNRLVYDAMRRAGFPVADAEELAWAVVGCPGELDGAETESMRCRVVVGEVQAPGIAQDRMRAMVEETRGRGVPTPGEVVDLVDGTQGGSERVARGGKSQQAGPMLVAAEVFEGKEACAADEIEWVSKALAMRNPDPHSAPSATAWSMYLWASQTAANTNQFWSQVYPKLLASRKDLRDRGADDDRDLETLIGKVEAMYEATATP